MAKTKTPPKKRGGVRPGAGRPQLEGNAIVQKLKEEARNFANEEIEAKTSDGKIIKGSRTLMLLRVLYDEAFKKRNLPAAKEFLDRTQGKAEQPLTGDGEDGAIHIKIDV